MSGGFKDVVGLMDISNEKCGKSWGNFPPNSDPPPHVFFASNGLSILAFHVDFGIDLDS